MKRVIEKLLIMFYIVLILTSCDSQLVSYLIVEDCNLDYNDITKEIEHVHEYLASNREESLIGSKQYFVIVNGMDVEADLYSEYGATYPTHTSLLPIAQALGEIVSWDRDTGFMFMGGLNGTILMQVGSENFEVNNEIISLSEPILLLGSQHLIYVPISFFSDVFGVTSAYFSEGLFVISTEAAPQELEYWQKAYAELLWHYSAAIPPPEDHIQWKFILYDVDRNGIPELIIVYIAAGIWSEAIYSFAYGSTIRLEGDFFAYYGIYPPINRPGILIQAYGRTDLMVLDEGKLVTELALSRPFIYGDAERWYINEVEVTEEEFSEMYNSIMPVWDDDFNHRLNIWPAEITDANIRGIIFGFESHE